MKAGTYLGGIRSIEDIRLRCRIDEMTGCWHWGMSMCDGHPKVHLHPDVLGERVKTTGPTAVYALMHRTRPPKGQVPRRKCLVSDCMNPEHMALMTRAEHGLFLSKAGVFKGQPRRIAANRATRRKRAKLDAAKAREIRASGEVQQVLARRYGVPQSTIWAIKAGRIWRETTAASVFSWGATA